MFQRLLIFSGLSLATVLWNTESAADPLTKRQQEVLVQRILPAYMEGSPLDLANAVGVALKQFRPEQVPGANQWLAQQGIPPLDELLGQAHASAVEQRLGGTLVPTNAHEAAVVLRTLKIQIEAVLAERDKHLVFVDPAVPPRSMVEFESLFWKMHVLENQLESAARLAQHAQRIASRFAKKKSLRVADMDQAVLDEDYVQLVTRVSDLHQELLERRMEWRLLRLAQVDSVLTSSSDIAERMYAAFALDLDKHAFSEFFAQRNAIARESAPAGRPEAKKSDAKGSRPIPPDPRPTPNDHVSQSPALIRFRTRLTDPDLSTQVQKLVIHSEQAAGSDLMQKSRWLFTGLHWWLRGRYGMGPLAGGLLKHPAANTSWAFMFPLFMPQEPPVPTDPASSTSQLPQVDRRHHYLWQLETRGFVESWGIAGSTVRGTGPNGPIDVAKLSRFY